MTAATPRDILVKARDLISDPARWTQGYMARDENGHKVGFDDKRATCWCAVGAFNKVVADADLLSTYPALLCQCDLYLTKAINYRCLDIFNDTATHPQIIAVFDKAIALAAESGL